MEPLGYGPYQVTIIENFILKLDDGTKIASKVWFPGTLQKPFDSIRPNWIKSYCEASSKQKASELDNNFPTVLEFLPYNKGTYTAQRDHLRHPWLATHGYVVIRPDIRGTGDSTGFYFDEYTKQVIVFNYHSLVWHFCYSFIYYCKVIQNNRLCRLLAHSF